MYTKVPKMMTFSALALWILVQTISAKGIKPNNETVSLYSLPLYNLEQNKSLSMNSAIGGMLLVLLPWGAQNTSRGDTDEKKTKET